MGDERKITDKQAEDNGGAIDDRKFRRSRRLILTAMIVAVLCVIGFLISGLVRSLYGGDVKKGGSDKLQMDEKFSEIKADLTIGLPGGVKMEMILVKAGSFKMSQKDDAQWKDEKEHDVTLKNDFYIGRTEVTQAQYLAVTGKLPSRFAEKVGLLAVAPQAVVCMDPVLLSKDFGRRPVEMVSWDDAMAFCDLLNATGKAPEGWEFTLPTETQWEYAARGGVAKRKHQNNGRTAKYSGSDELKEVGWYGDSDSDDTGSDGIKGATHPVATKAANELGLYDMSGNVWEWCLDDYIYDSDKTLPEERLEISGVCDGEPVHCQARTVRGGSWSKDARYCRVSTRYYYKHDLRFSNVGFRVALARTPVAVFDAWKAAVLRGDLAEVKARTVAKDREFVQTIVKKIKTDPAAKKDFEKIKVVSCTLDRHPVTYRIKVGSFVDKTIRIPTAELKIKDGKDRIRTVRMVKAGRRWKVADFKL